MSADATQAEIAQGFGCAQSKISAIEKGDLQPGLDFLLWFAENIETSVQFLLTGKDIQGPQGSNDNHSHNYLKEDTSSYSTADDFEQRIIGMLRRLPGEARQHLTNMITTAYYDHMESLTDESGKKNEGNNKN